ncbi:arabinose ABC transporter permease [Lentzea guizhouensis]|uniref:Arabinose ABC transporter permease n=1 Tax=Lentzea guizhouensis TaxID=1586287 RepID=A0A1B2I0K3_9PSEU|nr:arabinose ABC transporter permease [Lentzea guizhouensis]
MALIGAGTALVGVSYGFARFAYGLFGPVFQKQFALDSTLLGVIGAGSYVAYGGAIIAGFVLTNRYGPRRVAAAAGALATAGTALVAASTNGTTLAAGILIAGTSTGLASPPMAEAIARTVEAGRQDRAQSVVNAGTGIGVLLSGPIAMLLLDDWRLAWATFAVLSAAVTVWVLTTVPRGAGTTGRESGRLLPPGATPMLLAAFLLGLASSAVWTFGRDVVETGPTVATIMWSLIGAAGLLGAFSGHLTGSIGLRTSWTVVLVLMSAATATLALWPAGIVLTLTAAAVFGASYIALSGLVLVWSTRVHHDRPATGVGTSFLMIAAGQAVGALLAGVVIDHFGHVSAFLAAVVAGLLGAALRPARTISSTVGATAPLR